MSNKLDLLEKNIRELSKLKGKISLEDLLKNKIDEWALRYGFFESIQIVIDLSCRVVNQYNLGNPQSYSDCVEILSKEKYIDDDLANRLKSMIGLRNILIHDYIQIDLSKLYEMLSELEDFQNFVSKIKKYIINE